MGYGNAKIIKNSIFLKVEEGKPHTIRLLDSEPTEQFQHQINGKLVNCGGDLCTNCTEGLPRQQRFVTNTYDHSEGRVLLWSYGPGIAKSLMNIALGLEKDEESILDHDLEVSATGTGLQKKTSVQVRLKSQLVPAGIKLHSIGGTTSF
jgi:hypothetical protein